MSGLALPESDNKLRACTARLGRICDAAGLSAYTLAASLGAKAMVLLCNAIKSHT